MTRATATGAEPGHRERLVAALGGNALQQRGEPLEADVQRKNVELAATSLGLLASDYDVVVTHGNGPQVGLLALEAAAYTKVKPYPLDVLDAESEGMIGYLIEESLRKTLPDRPTATLLTQIVVDPADPAFQHPTKPIGPFYESAEAQQVASTLGWTMAPQDGSYRRVVPSPEPREIVELATIELLVGAGTIVVCAGGGGIPVVRDDGGLRGVEAVIDKDLASALLATKLGARFLLLLTDVDAVVRGWGTPQAAKIGHTTPQELRSMHFEQGSMGPKVEAACRFVEATGGTAAIGALADARALVLGTAGTRVAPSKD
ncbi:MAG TPA: carbamate kinase [Gaiellaceae bacterium]|nr:carbamate kinase [Gaiellaceae bacterium]